MAVKFSFRWVIFILSRLSFRVWLGRWQTMLGQGQISESRGRCCSHLTGLLRWGRLCDARKWSSSSKWQKVAIGETANGSGEERRRRNYKGNLPKGQGDFEMVKEANYGRESGRVPNTSLRDSEDIGKAKANTSWSSWRDHCPTAIDIQEGGRRRGRKRADGHLKDVKRGKRFHLAKGVKVAKIKIYRLYIQNESGEGGSKWHVLLCFDFGNKWNLVNIQLLTEHEAWPWHHHDLWKSTQTLQ